VRNRWGLFTIGLFILGCQSNDEASLPTESTVSSQLSLADEVQYLPYGVPAPEILPPNTRPEPYNFEKHGPPLPNKIPHLNLAKIPGEGTKLPGRGIVGDSPTTVQPLNGFNKGLRWFSSTYLGLTGEHEIETSLVVPYTGEFEVVFAPVALPSGSACVEMATTHRRFPQDAAATRHLVGWWDWCLASGAPDSASVEEDMTNSLWQQWYTRINPDGNRAAYIEVIYDGSQGYPCWNGLIYNYYFGYWESKLYSCYPWDPEEGEYRTSNWTGNGTEGWAMWEGKGSIEKSCPDMAGTSARNLEVQHTSGQWANINVVAPSLNTGTMCWSPGSTDWTMQYIQETIYSHWKARTPNP
jgi:hypothetical protein